MEQKSIEKVLNQLSEERFRKCNNKPSGKTKVTSFPLVRNWEP